MSRRERQIMRVIYRMGRSTVHQVRDALSDAPSLNTVRTLIQILEKKGHLNREKQGREFVYFPKKSRIAAGLSELQNVLDTFFEDSIGEALATHLTRRGEKISAEEYEKLSRLIEESRSHKAGSDNEGAASRKRK